MGLGTQCFLGPRSHLNILGSQVPSPTFPVCQKLIGTKTIITNIYRIQAYDSIMWGCFLIRFIEIILKGKSLLGYTNSFASNTYRRMIK